MKKKLILVSHGKLSEGMMHSVQMICGESDELSCYGMMPGEHYAEIVQKIHEQSKEHPDTQYIVLADLLGGSVCNGCTELVGCDNVNLISGMNMGLVMELLLEPAPVSEETIEEKLKNSKEAMLHVTPSYISGQNQEEDFF